MARVFDASVLTNYLTNDAYSEITAYPFTMAIWFYPTDASTSAQTLFFLGRTDSNLHHIYLRLVGDFLNEPIALVCNAGGTSPVERCTTQSVMNTWSHACARVVSSTARSVVVNGDFANASVYSGTPIVFPTSLNRLAIGRRHNGGSGGATFDGRLAWASLYNVVLSDNDVTALANGTNPSRIRAKTLRGLWPIEGNNSPEHDYTQYANKLTITGTAPQAAGPPVEPFSKRLWGFHSVTALSGSTYTQSLSGAIAPLSTLALQPSKTLSGTITPASSIHKLVLSALSGTVGLISSITATKVALVVSLVLSSTITLTSSLQKASLRTLASTITPVSTVSKLCSRKSFSGTLTSVSSIATQKLALIYLITLASSLSLTSAIQKRALKSLTGVFIPISSIAKRVRKTFTGAISPMSTVAPIKVFAIISSGFTSMFLWFIRRRRH